MRAKSSESVSVFDHGFLYGDGLYETLRCYDGHPALWVAHWRRLVTGARLIGLRLPPAAEVYSSVRKILRRERRPNASLRITVTRGTGPLGLDPDACPSPTVILQLHPDRDLARLRSEGVSADLVSIRHVPPESLDCRIKSISLLNSVLAKREAKKKGVFEGILLNGKGELTEGTTTNVFFVRRGVVHTPALSCGLLPGITRAFVMGLAKKRRLSVREGRYKPSILQHADELFLTNCSLEIVPVTRWAKRRLRPGPVTRLLQEQYPPAIMATLLHERVPS